MARDDEPIEEFDEVEDVDNVDNVEDVYEVEDLDDEDGGAAVTGRPSKLSAVRGQLKLLFSGEPTRPGEHDIVRSPFVLWMTIATVILTVTGGIFLFVISRETTQRKIDVAMEEMNGGKYSQAIALFEEFLDVHATHKLAKPARIERDRCLVLSQIKTSTPNYKEGFDALQKMIRAHRDSEQFGDLKESIFEYAQIITEGAAEKAEQAQSQELLDVSHKAFNVLNRYKPPEGISQDLDRKIHEQQQVAHKAVIRKETFETEIARIEGFIDAEQPVEALKARRELMQRNELFSSRKELEELLARILTLEQSRITRADEPRQARQEEYPATNRNPLTVTLNSRSSTSDEVGSRYVFCIAQDSVYGIDTVTGTPVWRRVIGLNTPFDPIEVENPAPGLLLFDTNHAHLILIDRKTGSLIWRQETDGTRAAPPLVHLGQIYLPTAGRNLFKIGLESGRVTSRVTFSQPVIGPPALSADERHIVLPGEQEVVYTLSLAPLQCVAVALLGHQPGTIEVPMTTMGRLLLFIENDQADSSLLRVLRGGEDATQLEQVADDRIEGQIRDRPIMRGHILFVPSNPQTITAFTVSDDPDQPPLTRLATQQLQDAAEGPMYLYAGPAGQFWLFSRALRRFELRTDNIRVDPRKGAVGFATQPVQAIGDKFFLGRRPDYARSVFFTQTDRQALTGFWRTVLGTRILASTSHDSDSIIAVTDSGDVFRVLEHEILQGGFKLDSTVRIRFPDKLTDPVGAVVDDDERIVVYCGQPEPALWRINRLGRIERKWDLAEPLQAAPVTLPDGIVAPMSGKLRMTGRSTASARVEDYRVKVEPGQQPPAWKFLLRADDHNVLAFDDRNRMIKVQYRENPRPSLSDVAPLELESPVDVRPAVHRGRLFVATADSRLVVYDARSLDIHSQFDLSAPASQPPWVVGDRVYLEIGATQLICFEAGNDVGRAWETPLNINPLAGPPLPIADNGIVLASRNGQVRSIDQDGNPIREEIIGQPLNGAPQILGGVVFVTSIDGSLYPLDQTMFVAGSDE